MRKLFLHVGFAKCGSTSLQEALLGGRGIYFPKSGVNGAEHLSLPLYIRGVDDWTRQYFDEVWAESQHSAMLHEISDVPGDVFISSERLAAMSEEEIKRLLGIFSDFQIEIVIVERRIEKYLGSTWRHAVFYHDYAVDYEDFLAKMNDFSFGRTEELFSKYFPVHVFDMDDEAYPKNLGHLIGTTIDMPRSNVGVPMSFAKLLQELHKLMGSKDFKALFTPQRKARMLEVVHGKRGVDIEPILAPLF